MQVLPIRVYRVKCTLSSLGDYRFMCEDFCKMPTLQIADNEQVASNETITEWLSKHNHGVDMNVIHRVLKERKENEMIFLDMDLAEISLFVYNHFEKDL